MTIANASDDTTGTFFSARRATTEERYAAGVARRAELPLDSHALLPSGAVRRDPLALLHAQDAGREAELVPIRYQRMTTSPFAFLRGAAAVMAADLSLVPGSGLEAQLCGDAHLENFGLFASTERSLVFDLNDFDESLKGPFEWDVKRLASSFVLAAQSLGFTDRAARKAALRSASAYRKVMATLAAAPVATPWIARMEVAELRRRLGRSNLGRAVERAEKKSHRRDSRGAVAKLTVVQNGQRRFRNDPPLLVPVPDDQVDQVTAGLAQAYRDYLGTIPVDRVALLGRFSFVELAHKVVGVGSVGTHALLMLLESGDGEPLLLQLKQAGPSVLQPYLPPSPFANAGQRVVAGQRAMQVSGDPFLGWCRGGERAPHDFYVRQLQDHKGGIDLAGLDRPALRDYARICGSVLARAHAKVGDAATISGYLGDTEAFDQAVADFAVGYAHITVADHARLVAGTARKEGSS